MTGTINLENLSAEQLRQLAAEKESEEKQDRLEKRKSYEALRDQTVTEMVSVANALKESLVIFKTKVFSDLETMYKLLQEHSSRHSEGKGSFTLETADNTMKVTFRRQDNTRFDERATQAEQHILDFLTTQFGDNEPTSKLVRKLLERRKGQLDKDQVLNLISMKDDFDNENWRKGIELLQESIVPGNTKYYAQFFVKLDGSEDWTPIVMDFAKL